MAHVRKHPKSGRYQVRYRDPSGRERSRNFDRKVDAVRFADAVATDVRRGDYLDPAAGKVTVGEYANAWMATRGRLARATQDRDRSVLTSLVLPVFGDRPVVSIRPSEVVAWMAGLDRAAYTVAKARWLLYQVIEVARRDGAVRVNPAADAAAPPQEAQRPGRALSDVELAKVFTAAEAVDPRTAPMVVLMGTMGLRVGEALALRRPDVDLVAGVLHVRQSLSRREGERPLKGRRRGDEGRRLPMPAAAVEALRGHLAGPVVNLDGYVFTSPRGSRISYTRWRTRVWDRIRAEMWRRERIHDLIESAGSDKVAAAIGLDEGYVRAVLAGESVALGVARDDGELADVRPHDLRHTTATRLFVVDRWTPGEVQQYLGHRDPRTTLKIYTHVASESLPRPSSAADTSRTPGAVDGLDSVASNGFGG